MTTVGGQRTRLEEVGDAFDLRRSTDRRPSDPAAT